MNEKVNESLLSEVSSYYSDKLAEYGATPRGVDWNGEGSQILRFEQLCRLIQDESEAFSLNDLGCGYGSMFDFLSTKYSITSYLGIDVSEDMVRAAESRHKESPVARFIVKAEPDTVADYSIASGIFNVRLERTDHEWYDYLQTTLDILDRTSHRGFAFNCLTSYSDEDKKRDYLYYADPCRLFDLCKNRYSRNVALLHDYELFEFTILVRKSL
jgi:hypothetical protein